MTLDKHFEDIAAVSIWKNERAKMRSLGQGRRRGISSAEGSSKTEELYNLSKKLEENIKSVSSKRH